MTFPFDFAAMLLSSVFMLLRVYVIFIISGNKFFTYNFYPVEIIGFSDLICLRLLVSFKVIPQGFQWSVFSTSISMIQSLTLFQF